VDTEIRSKVVAVIQSLSNNSPDHDSLLTFALGDTIDRAPKVINATTISSTAFVLPCVSLPSDDFPVDIDKATYFLVMPP
jgi:Ca2+/H+ antiporter